MKRTTRRQQLLAVLLVLAIACGVSGALIDSLVPMYFELVLVFVGLFIVLQSSERGQHKGFRKTEKMQDLVVSRLNHLGSKLDQIEGQVTTDSGLSPSKGREPGNTDALLRRVDEFIEEINDFIAVENQPSLSQRVSIKKVVDWLNPSLVLTTEAWKELLQQDVAADVAEWIGPTHTTHLGSEIKLVIVDGESFNEQRGALMASSYLRSSALMIVDTPKSEEIESISGYMEIAPVGIMHGVQLFYPDSAIEPLKFSKLVKYT